MIQGSIVYLQFGGTPLFSQKPEPQTPSKVLQALHLRGASTGTLTHTLAHNANTPTSTGTNPLRFIVVKLGVADSQMISSEDFFLIKNPHCYRRLFLCECLFYFSPDDVCLFFGGLFTCRNLDDFLCEFLASLCCPMPVRDIPK